MIETRTDSASPFLEAHGVSKRYPGVQALNDVSFSATSGEILGLVGKNGAGKSTLIKVLAGIVKPDTGQVVVDGHACTLHHPRDAARAGLAFVHQELADVPGLTVAENVLLGLGFPGYGPFVNDRQLRVKATSVLERLEVDFRASALVGDLSVVQRRMVMIARALAQEARMVVLDEPSASLTAEEVDHLHGAVRRLARDGVAVVYVSHRLPEILSLSQRVVVMRDGEVVADRPTSELEHGPLVALICGDNDMEASGRGTSRTPAGHAGSSRRRELLSVRGLAAEGAVEDATLTVHEGEILGIAGLVGSGRTELARALFGAERITAGSVHFRGQPLRLRSPRDAIKAGIALLPEERQSEGILKTFSLRENVTISSLPKHRIQPLVPVPSLRSERATAKDAIARLKVSAPGAETDIELLSGGNQQKVLFAKWFERSPSLFILDEPTHGIDVEAKEEIFDLLEGLAKANKSVIFISSDFTEIVNLCDSIVVLRDRRTVAEFRSERVTERALLDACYPEPELSAGDARGVPSRHAPSR